MSKIRISMLKESVGGRKGLVGMQENRQLQYTVIDVIIGHMYTRFSKGTEGKISNSTWSKMAGSSPKESERMSESL